MSKLVFEFEPIDQIFDDVAIPFEDWSPQEQEKARREAAELQRKKKEAAKHDNPIPPRVDS